MPAAAPQPMAPAVPPQGKTDEEQLDIPAFLRRQAN